MKQSLAQDTLAFQIGVRPALQFRDQSAVPLQQVVKAMKGFFALSNLYEWAYPITHKGPVASEPLEGYPEVDALQFYMLNHAVSLIGQRCHPLQPLGQYLPIVERYHQELSLRTARMFYYLLLICTREARHEKHSAACAALQQKYGIPKSFQQSFPDSSGSAMDYMVDNAPAIALGPFTEFLAAQFYKGSYSSSFGGKAWGAVADCLRDFVLGKTTAEMMMDTAFTLCHNGGPIFNKGMLYHHHDNSALSKILDVQRSGQIPQLVAANELGKFTGAGPVKQCWSVCRSVLGEVFDGEVDWFKVEQLGALGTYTAEKQAQKGKPLKTTPMSLGNGTTLGALLKKKLEQDPDAFKEEVEEEEITKGPKLYLYPNQFIVKVKSPRAK